jgi:hypothetical protein
MTCFIVLYLIYVILCGLFFYYVVCYVYTLVNKKDICCGSNQNQNQKVLFKVGTFCNNQHKLSRAFQTDMHNKLHKLNTAQ